jgi:hypothetical protein
MRLPIVCFVLALAAQAAAAKPVIKEVQASYGQLGPERKGSEYVRGDEVFVRYTIAGLKADDDGKVRVEMTIAYLNAKGEEVEKNAIPVQHVLALGGDSFPGIARVNLLPDTPLGEYTLRVTITDQLARESATFDYKYTVKAEEFALTAMRFHQDRDGRVPAPIGGIVGQTVFLQMRAVGFDRSDDEFDLELGIQVFDSAGKPVMPKPLTFPLHSEKAEVVRKTPILPLRGEITLNRAGDFVLKVTLMDKKAKKTVTFEAPLKAVEPGVSR